MDETGDGCLNLEEFQLPGTVPSKAGNGIFWGCFGPLVSHTASQHAMCFFELCVFSVPWVPWCCLHDSLYVENRFLQNTWCHGQTAVDKVLHRLKQTCVLYVLWNDSPEKCMEGMNRFILEHFLIISKEVGSVSKAEILDEPAGVADFLWWVVRCCVLQLPRVHMISDMHFWLGSSRGPPH